MPHISTGELVGVDTGSERFDRHSRTAAWPRMKRAYTLTPSDRNGGRLSSPRTKRQCLAQPESTDSPDETSETTAPNNTLRKLSHVSPGMPAYPRSLYSGWQSPQGVATESDAVQFLSNIHDSAYFEKPDHVLFRLDHFSIYRPHHGVRADELVSLDKLTSRGCAGLLFDGLLSVSDTQIYVQGVPFSILTVDGYGDVNATRLGEQLCIQSSYARARNVWYSLGIPSPVYHRFYTPFLWIARFAKHFVDYLLVAAEKKNKVSLQDFRVKFYAWLITTYHNDTTFDEWHSVAKLIDFRTTIAANIEYLYKECYSIDDNATGLCQHPIWGEVHPFRLEAIPSRPNLERHTIVTPFAYTCFKQMYFADQLEERLVSSAGILRATKARKLALGLTPLAPTSRMSQGLATPMSLAQGAQTPIIIRKGDVVSVNPDNVWRAKDWYAYVQHVEEYPEVTRLDVIYLYDALDTTLGNVAYPFKNELFMSDNCVCGSKTSSHKGLDAAYVIGKVDVSWFVTDPYAYQDRPDFFVRRTYRTVDHTQDFVTLRETDFHCQCEHRQPIFTECQQNYRVGDTVLIRAGASSEDILLNPAQIIRFDQEKRRVQLRRLLRTEEVDSPPNELKLSSETYYASASCVVRKCHVRHFGIHDRLPPPYDRGGTGDFFFVRGSLDADPLLVGTFPPLMEGRLQFTAQPTLTGMGIFCGGGTFDRGLEEGGSVVFKYAVDWAEHALHSHRANATNPERMHYFLGSVNDYLALALSGKGGDDIARPGDFHVLAAGSPCPAFSSMQLQLLSQDSKRNASMVASVISYVDLYSPEYLILENVPSMCGRGFGPNKDEYIFQQIVASLVAMGYQVQQLLGDAWSYGSPQQRSRVFIIALAPGLSPFEHPAHSHAHPPNIQIRALGRASNGEKFGIRRDNVTPFHHVTPRQAVADLPSISDGQVQICPPFPDHRTPIQDVRRVRDRIASVPTRPRGMGLMQAFRSGRLRGEPARHTHHHSLSKSVRGHHASKMYMRINPEALFPTILTRMLPGDGIAGKTLHWDEPRNMSVMEARRAQGYLDHEVIVGTPTQQVQIIGNSVDRRMALVLGLALNTSWNQSQTRQAVQTATPPTGEDEDDLCDGDLSVDEHEFKRADDTLSVEGIDLPSYTHPLVLVERTKAPKHSEEGGIKASLSLGDEDRPDGSSIAPDTSSEGSTFERPWLLLDSDDEL